MNHLRITKHRTDPDAPHRVQLTLSSEIEELMMTPMREAYEVSILQGARQVLPDGQVHIEFELTKEQAGQLSTAFMIGYNKYLGLYSEN